MIISNTCRVVLATIIVTSLTIGPHFVVSEYDHPLRSRYGWRSDFLQITVAVGSVGYVISGWLSADIKVRGFRVYCVIGCVCAALSHALAALGVTYNSLPLFILGQGVLDTLGGGFLMTVCMSHATQWLDPAVGASLVGGLVGISATGMSYAMLAMIQNVSPESCLWGLTGLALLASPAALLFRTPPAAPGPEIKAPLVIGVNSHLSLEQPPQNHMTRSDALGNPLFYCVWLTVCCGLIPGFALISAYTPLFEKTLKIHYVEAAVLTGVCNGTYCIGRALGGILCRLFGVRQWGMILTTLGIFGSGMASVSAGSHATAFVFGVCLIAFQLGACQVYAGPLIAHVFGKQNMPVVYGLILIAVAAASVVGPFGLFATLDVDMFFVASTGVLGLAFVCVTIATTVWH
eukprot:PhF_6_TR40573/c0_g1_i1/m.60839/K08177/oxlT; MFS transporter, OFA family, oxalate/formate antiporter